MLDFSGPENQNDRVTRAAPPGYGGRTTRISIPANVIAAAMAEWIRTASASVSGSSVKVTMPACAGGSMVESVVVAPVIGQHGAPQAGGASQHVGVGDSLVGPTRLQGRQGIVAKVTKKLDQCQGHVFVREQRGHAGQSSSFSRMAFSVSSR